eukprot:5002183-Amphidinium_carterae.1
MRFTFLKANRVLFSDGVFVSACTKYVDDILRSLGMEGCKSQPTPISCGRHALDDEDPITDEETKTCYRHC